MWRDDGREATRHNESSACRFDRLPFVSRLLHSFGGNVQDNRAAGVIVQLKTRVGGGSACIVLLFGEYFVYSFHVTFFCLREASQIGLMDVIQTIIPSILRQCIIAQR